MTGTAVTKRGEFQANLDRWAPQLAGVAYRGFTPERILTATLTAAVDMPALFDCDPKTVGLALMKVARLGLDIGEGIYLVPVKDTKKGILRCEAWCSYQGLKALAYRQRLCRLMQEYVVYEGDEFEYHYGLGATLRHRPGPEAQRGPLTHAYSVIRLVGGDEIFHLMSIADIEVVRSGSRQWGPNKLRDCPPWYAMKTVVRNWLNKQPKTGILTTALQADDTAPPAGVDPETGEVLDVPEGDFSDLAQSEEDAELDRLATSR